MEELTILKDFAVIMIIAGVVTLLFRVSRQPPVLGYLIAGLLAGPYIFHVRRVTDIYTVTLLAELGLILLLFGLGLEFSWGKIREVGLAVLFIGVIEILVMICLGYGLSRLLGWSRTDALFLGALIIPRIMAFVAKFRSKEVIFISSLGLCFGMALLGDYLELSVAAGAMVN